MCVLILCTQVYVAIGGANDYKEREREKERKKKREEEMRGRKLLIETQTYKNNVK